MRSQTQNGFAVSDPRDVAQALSDYVELIARVAQWIPLDARNVALAVSVREAHAVAHDIALPSKN